jgi:hypothetical protein
MAIDSKELPAYEDLPVDVSAPPGSSWGVFGPGDQVGTVNLLTPDRVRRGAGLVRKGLVFSLNWNIELPDPPLLGREPLRHTILDVGCGTDDFYDNFYPQGSSQWDALSHIGHPQYGFYNGRKFTDFTGRPGSLNGIDNWARRGIVGRFVLADIGRFSPNTNNLGRGEDPDGRGRWQARAWPGAVRRALDPEARHLALDDPGVRAQSPYREEHGENLGDGTPQGAGEEGSRGDARADAPPGGVERPGEGETIGIDVLVVGGGRHEGPQGVVDAAEPEGLLVDTLDRPGAQHDARAALVGLELVERRLDLPAFGIQGRELRRRGGSWIEDRGDEAIAGVLGPRSCRVLERVLDDPDRERVLPAAIERRCELGRIRAVGMARQDRQHGVALRSPDEVGARGGGHAPEGVGGEAPIGEAEHPGRQRPDERLGEGGLAGRAGAHGDGEHRVGATLGEGHHPELGVRGTLPAPGARPTEVRGVGLCVGHIERRAVQAHEPEAPVEGASCGRRGERPAGPREQLGERRAPEACPRLADGGLAGDLPVRGPARSPGEALGEAAEHLLVARLGEEGHGEDVVDDEARRQEPVALFAGAGGLDHRVDERRREGCREHPERDVVGEALVVPGLQLSCAWHAGSIPEPRALSYWYWA